MAVGITFYRKLKNLGRMTGKNGRVIFRVKKIVEKIKKNKKKIKFVTR